MSSHGWKEEFETADKYDKRRRILLWTAAIIFISCVVFVFSAWASYPKQPANSSNETVKVESIPYKYSKLGESCSKAITDYDDKITGLSSASDTLVKKIGGPTYAALAYEQEELPKYNQLSIDYLRLRGQGVISQEEYEQQMKAVDKAVEHINDVKAQASIDSSTLYTSIMAMIQSNDNKIQEYTDKRNKLVTCVDSANNKQDFSISDVADFESIIAGSR